VAETRRDLIYRMTADPEAFKRGMREAGQDSRAFYKELKQLEKQQQAVDSVMTATGFTAMGFGVAVGAGLAVAAKAAIDWESAWTGVAKVVDGTPEQLAALEGELRDLATTLPQTHAEIAGVAAAAGQLGIAREDIADFTQTMVAMGVSTDLASEDAAMAMARLMNIMQTAPSDVDKLGSAIVGLGNSGASTEAEIVEMALRIAGAGHTVGMTEAEVLAFSSALASVGIEAESGGSSVSTAMIKISEAVNEGGDSLATFAQVAGVSADEFASKFRSDPATAINMFVQGLGRIQSSGGDVFATLETLGMSEIRLRDALLRLAGAGDLLTESLATGNEAWDENSALMEEAARRYGTTEAQMQIARNQLVDLGITLGEVMLPAINKFLDVASGMLSWFQDLPAGLQQTVVWLGVAATAVTLVGGAALIAVPKIHALNVALGEIGGKKASAVQSALGRVTGFLAGPWGIAIGAAVAVAGLFVASQAETRARVDEVAGTLDQQTGAITENTRAWAAHELEQAGALEAAQALGIDMQTLTDAVLGNARAAAEVEAAYTGAYGEAERFLEANDLTSLDEAEGALREEAEALIANGEAADILKRQMGDLNGEYQTATEEARREAAARGESTDAMAGASAESQVLAETLGITTAAAENATEAFDELHNKVRALIDSAFALNEAEREVQAGIDTLTESLNENGATVDSNTEKGRANEQAIEDQIAAIAELAVTTAEQTGSTEEANAVLDEQTAALVRVLKQAGFTEEEIQNYIGVLDSVPGAIQTAVQTKGVSAAINQMENIKSWMNAINRTVTISFRYENFMPRGGAAIPKKDGGIVGYANGGLPSFPDGGMFRGIGGPRSDSNLVAISDGEFIVNAESTKRHRALLETINSRSGHAASRSSSVRMPVNGGGGSVLVQVDFRGASDALTRGLQDLVRVQGNGDVQVAFGSS